MDFDTRYHKLNAAQKQAVDTIDGPVMVIAGPGTGKTELLSMRAANILRKTDTLPDNILCLTFTDSGANAMRERLTQIIGADAYKIAIHTFHSFGSEIINQNGQFFYQGAGFRPADELSSYQLLRTILDGLEYNNPLAGKMNGEYTHIRDITSTISELKKSGLVSAELLDILDANDGVIEKAEPLLATIFTGRISKTTTDQLQPLAEQIRNFDGVIELPTIPSLAAVLADSLEQAVSDATTQNSTKPITAWRNKWMKKNDLGEFILKARERSVKLRAVSTVYDQYLNRMQEAELYDFDDMILRVVHAMEIFPELRFNLQEKYQYIMVDEFQDTNLAQMRILLDLTNSEVNAGRPNVMIVGDDDQAIYSFQGADISNIGTFRSTYDQTVLITLVDNYRSTETILSHARGVITQGTDRLENHITELDKTLQAHFEATKTSVSLVELPDINHERSWVVTSIEQQIKNGVTPNSIAVLARRHHELVALLPYLAEKGIAVNYERQDDVLQLDIIQLIEHLSSLLVALFEQRHQDANSLLPKLLAHPSFAIDPMALWKLSLAASKSRESWMEIMAVTSAFIPIHEWLVIGSQMLAHTTLEQMLDYILGSTQKVSSRSSDNFSKHLQPDGETMLGSDPPTGAKLFAEINDGKGDTVVFSSPLYDYFFSTEKLNSTPDLYLTYLEALRTIRTKLCEYMPNEVPKLQTFLEFIRLHRELGSTITSIRPRSTKIDDAICLMTAHKSKGQEFEHVYIIGAIDSAWGERVRTRSRLIGYPENLPLAPAGDTFDERLRLFFVAMTRARKNLVISYALANDDGKSTLRASFLTSDAWTAQTPESTNTIDDLVHDAELMWYQPLTTPVHPSMKELLRPVLENYKLTITDLNSFLDVTRGGPQMFLLNNLLKFPRAVSPSAGYGTAIHATLHHAHIHVGATGSHHPIEDILHDFEQNLQAQRLSETDFNQYLERGSTALTKFLAEKYDSFSATQKPELSFDYQNVFIGDAHLTGKLDLVDINEDTAIVTDYKTGKPSRNWTGATDYEKIKLHKFKQQLMFYDLLLAHSRDYSKYTVEKGVLQFVEPTPRGEILALEASFTTEELYTFTKLIQAVWRHIITLDLPESTEFDPSYKGMLALEAQLLDETP
jgi:DNA helicase-2/ATP-dependent DNA helicase PcrA